MSFPDQTQKEIVYLACSKRARITAGPGSGKTQVAAARLLHLLESGVKPQEISVLSFSRAAVSNFNKRIAKQTTDDFLKNELRLVSIRTFDSFAFNLLRYSGRDAGLLLRRTHDENIADASATLRESSPIPEHLSEKKHFIIDEFQDLPSVRGEFVFELLKKLSTANDFGFTLLGDPAQAIFTFADRKTDESKHDWWEKIGCELCDNEQRYELKKNYRAESKIAQVIEFLHTRFIENNVQPEQLFNFSLSVLTKLPTSRSFPEDASNAVLVRTNGDLLNLHKNWFGKDEEPRRPLPNFLMRDGKTSPPAWIARILHDCGNALVSFPEIEHRRKMAVGPEGHPSRNFLEKILFLSGAVENNQLNLPLFCSRLNWPHIWPDELNYKNDGPVFSTIHQAKGLEFDKVTLLYGENKNVNLTACESREEASVLFVAFSRAKQDINKLRGWQNFLNERDFGDSIGRRWASPRTSEKIYFEIKPQDIDQNSFVSLEIFKSSEAVAVLQNFLWNNRELLIGRKVVVVRRFDKTLHLNRFMIHLQENDQPTMLLGELSRGEPGSSFGLLIHKLKEQCGRRVLWPSRIYNLRISAVESFASSGGISSDIASPYNKSGIWLGIRLQGLGFFERRFQ